MRKPRLGVFFLIDFSILVFGFSLTVILDSGSVLIKDIQMYLCNLIETEPEPKSNRASDTDNTDDTDDANNTENADNAENADCWSVPSPYHVTWPISRLPGPINFICVQHPLSIVLRSNTHAY